jgi:cytochrome oxidase Cu insertion factor (SCO1/SenC/PrrC family)
MIIRDAARAWLGCALACGLVAGAVFAQEAGKPGAAKTESTDDAAKAGKKEMVKPKVGEPAPEIDLPDQSGKKTTLAQFKGKKNVLLAFYPKSFTGG